jgi:hypothetical protein
MGFRVYLYYYGFAGHVGGGAGYFGSGYAAGTAPGGPKIYEHRDRGVLHDFVEEGFVDFDGLGDGRQG